MSPGVFVAVDSGGTLTNVDIAVAYQNGDTRSACYEVGSSLSGALAPSLMPKVVGKILAPLLSELDGLGVADLPLYIWLSAAGYSQGTRDDFTSAIQNIDRHVAGGLVHSIGAANDAVSLLLGSRSDGVVIAGTGSNVLVKASDGSLHQSGGQEWVACDYGSGFWIGLQAIRAAYRDFEAGDDSVLLQRLRLVYGLRSDNDRALISKMRDFAIADPHMKKEISRFAESVCSAAERGNEPAQDLVKAGAEELADSTAGLLRRQFSTDELTSGISLVQCGSVLGNDLYRSSFEAQINLRLKLGEDQSAALSWQRVTTGVEAGIRLAKDLAEPSDALLRISPDFRPTIVKF